MPRALALRARAGLEALALGLTLLITAPAPAAEQPAQTNPKTLTNPAPGAISRTCAAATASRPIPLPPGPLLQPAQTPAGPEGPAGDYRQRLGTTALSWPRLDRWCLWLEPVRSVGPAALWEQRWWQAVRQAIQHWQALLPIELVDDPAAAQIRILRRRPPREPDADGRLRASHGRASLQLLEVSRAGQARLEPSVDVLISPGQRPLATEATALHELGHAFGLWGHSDRADDAMAAVPGAAPVLELSARDRASVQWLYSEPTRFGHPLATTQPHGSGAAKVP